MLTYTNFIRILLATARSYNHKTKLHTFKRNKTYMHETNSVNQKVLRLLTSQAKQEKYYKPLHSCGSLRRNKETLRIENTQDIKVILCN